MQFIKILMIWLRVIFVTQFGPKLTFFFLHSRSLANKTLTGRNFFTIKNAFCVRKIFSVQVWKDEIFSFFLIMASILCSSHNLCLISSIFYDPTFFRQSKTTFWYILIKSSSFPLIILMNLFFLQHFFLYLLQSKKGQKQLFISKLQQKRF